MQHEGTIVFDTPRETLFDLLIDAEALAPCVPGLQSFEVVEPRRSFRLGTRAKLGTLTPEIELLVTFSLIERPERARLRIRGKGASSHVGASSYLYLEPTPAGGTVMHWSFTFTVYGQLASIGHRLLEQTFDRMHREFIDSIRSTVASRLAD